MIRTWCLLLCLPAVYATAGPAKQVYTIGVQDFSDYLPYSQVKKGSYTGFNRELLDRFAASQGYLFIYKPRPIKRLYMEFMAGEFDFKYPDNPYWSASFKKSRKVTIRYSDPVVKYIDGVMVRSDKQGSDINQLHTLGVVAGFTPFLYLPRIQSGAITQQDVPSYERLLQLVILGRLDGAYSNISVSRYYLDKILDKKGALVFNPSMPYTQSYRYLSSIQHPEIIEKFNQFLFQNRQRLQKLKDKYGVEAGVTISDTIDK